MKNTGQSLWGLIHSPPAHQRIIKHKSELQLRSQAETTRNCYSCFLHQKTMDLGGVSTVSKCVSREAVDETPAGLRGYNTLAHPKRSPQRERVADRRPFSVLEKTLLLPTHILPRQFLYNKTQANIDRMPKKPSLAPTPDRWTSTAMHRELSYCI